MTAAPAVPDSAAPAPSELPLLDREAGLRLTGGNAGLYRSLLTRFAGSLGQTAAQARAALAAQDGVLARRQVHSLKGSALQLGAAALADAASRAERAIVETQPDAVLATLLDALEREQDRLLAHLNEPPPGAGRADAAGQN
jgi:HPt (histidine-containing phosphotransfer) domain-containing protein